MYFDWNDKQVAALRDMAALRLSARVMADRLGCTRNAVIGKCKREYIPLLGVKPTTSHPYAKQKPVPVVKRPKPAKPGRLSSKMIPRTRFVEDFPVDPVVIHEDIYVAPENRKGVIQLEPGDCRWPIGDPRHADFHFCGHAQHGGLVYCEFHARKAYQSPAEVAARLSRSRRQAA